MVSQKCLFEELWWGWDRFSCMWTEADMIVIDSSWLGILKHDREHKM